MQSPRNAPYAKGTWIYMAKAPRDLWPETFADDISHHGPTPESRPGFPILEALPALSEPGSPERFSDRTNPTERCPNIRYSLSMGWWAEPKPPL